MRKSEPNALTSMRSRVGGWEIHAVHADRAPRGRVPDLPGHGRSSGPRDALTLGELADTLAAPPPHRALVVAGLWERVSLIPIVARDYMRMGLRRLRGELAQMFADPIKTPWFRACGPGKWPSWLEMPRW